MYLGFCEIGSDQLALHAEQGVHLVLIAEIEERHLLHVGHAPLGLFLLHLLGEELRDRTHVGLHVVLVVGRHHGRIARTGRLLIHRTAHAVERRVGLEGRNSRGVDRIDLDCLRGTVDLHDVQHERQGRHSAGDLGRRSVLSGRGVVRDEQVAVERQRMHRNHLDRRHLRRRRCRIRLLHFCLDAASNDRRIFVNVRFGGSGADLAQDGVHREPRREYLRQLLAECRPVDLLAHEAVRLGFVLHGSDDALHGLFLRSSGECRYHAASAARQQFEDVVLRYYGHRQQHNEADGSCYEKNFFGFHVLICLKV